MVEVVALGQVVLVGVLQHLLGARRRQAGLRVDEEEAPPRRRACGRPWRGSTPSGTDQAGVSPAR
ncbi:hypothetical protein [Nocardioides convexus]|uniref:hypothetical protein n=1 Tax=Nocardioides convexus TaxID=2712224 RepID=UPI00241823B1|nr:hypothetical protein [Nocardioides convexus]